MAKLDSDDYYEVLGVPKSSTQAEIKKAYRKLALKWHPDRHQADADDKKKVAEENFKTLSEAYEILSDETKRRKYDQFGKAAFDQSRGGAGGFHFSNANDIFRQFFGGGDPFAEIFGGGMRGGFGGRPGVRMRLRRPRWRLWRLWRRPIWSHGWDAGRDAFPPRGRRHAAATAA